VACCIIMIYIISINLQESVRMKNLLIVGAGAYGIVAKEIAESMGCFGKIDFLDDKNSLAVGKVLEYDKLFGEYTCIFVAIGNSDIRLDLLQKLEKSEYDIVTLISPTASVAPSAKVMCGSVIEPMAVVQSFADIGVGCLVCSGAVVKHNAVVSDGCYIDCNSVVMQGACVPSRTKVEASKAFC